jgi:uncharacterized protein YndB with AHSA1/START domain
MEQKNSATADRELKITRLINAPVSLVYEVFITPGHIKNWWGPDGFTNTIFKMEVRPGGEWEYIMHGPDGREYKNRNIFTEVVKNKKIVFDDVSTPIHTTTITFMEQGNKTRLTFHMLFPTPEEKENTVKVFKADIGLTQNIDKLEVYLKGQD